MAQGSFGYQGERDSARVAAAVQRISDFYLAKPDGKTPYDLPDAPLGYLLYFTLLNHVRALCVFREAAHLGFLEGIDSVVDWGSGMGAGWLAARQESPEALRASVAFDRSEAALRVQGALRGGSQPGHLLTRDHRLLLDFLRQQSPARTLAMFCYSLTELDALPEWALGCEALCIIEPGTHQDGRRLLKIRQELIDAGWKVWAPCTHLQPCPLLTHSKSDWCHDRVEWRQPTFYQQVETHLPMRHKTLVHSWLLARKTMLPPAALALSARLTGDQQELKGQTRQMICRG
ncbi:MAG: hypothetical protein RIQ81_258, partial [Pseudomonadota bacterium]